MLSTGTSHRWAEPLALLLRARNLAGPSGPGYSNSEATPQSRITLGSRDPLPGVRLLNERSGVDILLFPVKLAR